MNNMWGAKLLAAMLVASGITVNAMVWKMPKPEIDLQAASTVNKMDKFVYPGAQIVNTDNNNYIMVAQTSLEEATKWYTKTLDENKLKDKNVIRSDANGNKINLLIGTGLAGEMDVAIKEEAEGIVSIAVTNNSANYQQI